MDKLPLPALCSLRHGALVTCDRYSSSPSVTHSDSTVDVPVYNHPLKISNLITTTERLAEAERIINAVVHRSALGTADPANCPRTKTFFDLPPTDSSELLFCFKPVLELLPKLVEDVSSDSMGSSDLEHLNLDGCTEVNSDDCVAALIRMCQMAPTLDQSLQQRNNVHA
jgi:hypothetical protein